MRVPEVEIDASGNIECLSTSARRLFAAYPSVYRVMRAGSLVILAPDEGTGSAPREGETVALAGDIKAMPLLSLLNLLGQNRESGRLLLKLGKSERVVVLKDGEVASVGSNLPADRLGTFLVRTGRVFEADLELAEKEATENGMRIGQVLVEKKLIDVHELWTSIQSQITEIFSEVVGWSEGCFILYRFGPDHQFPAMSTMSMQGLLMEAVRRSDEMSVYRNRIANFQVAVQRTAKEPPESMEKHEQDAYNVIEEPIHLSEIAKKTRQTEFDTTRTCYALIKRGLIEVVKDENALEQAAVSLSPDQQARLDVYNLAFREIHEEVVRNGKLENYMIGMMRYLSDRDFKYHIVFRGVTPDSNGALPLESIVKNANDSESSAPMELIQEALNDLTFFLLFQCGELLDADSDENLGRRVRLIHSALQ